MMSLNDICSKFPTVKLSDAVTLNERNLFSAEMEDGSGFSWNLKARYDNFPFEIYVRFDNTSMECLSLTVTLDGAVLPTEKYCRGVWQHVPTKKF